VSFSQSDKDISSTRLKLPTSTDTHVAESSPLTPPPVAVFTAVRPCCPAGAVDGGSCLLCLFSLAAEAVPDGAR